MKLVLGSSFRLPPQPGRQGWLSPLPGYALPPGLHARQPVTVVACPIADNAACNVRTADGQTHRIQPFLVDAGREWQVGGERLAEWHPVVLKLLAEQYLEIHRRAESSAWSLETLGSYLDLVGWLLERNGAEVPGCTVRDCPRCEAKEAARVAAMGEAAVAEGKAACDSQFDSLSSEKVPGSDGSDAGLGIFGGWQGAGKVEAVRCRDEAA